MYHQLTRRLLLSTAFLSIATPLAEAQFAIPGANPASRASLIPEAKAIAPGGTFRVALSLEHPEGWHSYYQNSGGVELPPAIQWTLPEGFTAGSIQWPTPGVKDGFFGKSFVYSGNPVFLVDLTAPATVKAGESVTLMAKATWQICEDSCLNEDKSFSLTLPVAAAMEPDPAASAVFAKAAAAKPTNPAGWTFTAQPEGTDLVLRVKPSGALENDPIDFVPDQPFVKSVSSGGSIQRDGDAWLVRLQRAAKDALDNDIPQGDSV